MADCTNVETSKALAPRKDDIKRTLSLLFPIDMAFELKVHGADGVPHYKLGTFATGKDLEREPGGIVRLIAAQLATSGGLYFTPHGGRDHDTIKTWCNFTQFSKGGHHRHTHDEDIPQRRFLIVDVDPVRGVVGEMATDAEKGEAWNVADAVRGFLESHGWADPFIVDSGNGYHIYYRLATPLAGGPVDSAIDELAITLRLLDAKFSTDGAKIDKQIFNAARLMRIPGTVNRKGRGEGDRPHRVSRIVSMPDWSGPVRATELADLIAALDPTGDVRASFATPKAIATSAASPVVPTVAGPDVIRRASGYLKGIPEAIQGQNGSSLTYAAATALVRGFCLSESDALGLLMSEYNPRCVPPWSESELAHKVNDAATKQHRQPYGYEWHC